jgi:hypothetical protein
MVLVCNRHIYRLSCSQSMSCICVWVRQRTPFSMTLHLVNFSVRSGDVGDECLFFSLCTMYLLSNNLHASRFYLQTWAWFITYFRIHAWDIIGSFLHIYVSVLVFVFLSLFVCFHILNLSTTLAQLFALPKMSNFGQSGYVFMHVALVICLLWTA